MSLTLTSCLESAEKAETRVVDFSQQAGCTERQLHEIGLAVREGVANAVLHGNRCDSKKKVRLKAAVQQGALEIWIQDEGEGFDPDAVPDPLHAEQLLIPSGRGIFLVKACMDEIAVRRTSKGGTELAMIKYLSNAHPKSKPE
jgi:serine/threonine-protein kinase RsbW